MRLALAEAPVAEPGAVAWRTVDTGFDTADLDARVGQRVVDRIHLVRIDPALFRFKVKTAPSGAPDRGRPDPRRTSNPMAR